jgi:hypothetical protein
MPVTQAERFVSRAAALGDSAAHRSGCLRRRHTAQPRRSADRHADANAFAARWTVRARSAVGDTGQRQRLVDHREQTGIRRLRHVEAQKAARVLGQAEGIAGASTTPCARQRRAISVVSRPFGRRHHRNMPASRHNPWLDPDSRQLRDGRAMAPARRSRNVSTWRRLPPPSASIAPVRPQAEDYRTAWRVGGLRA